MNTQLLKNKFRKISLLTSILFCLSLVQVKAVIVTVSVNATAFSPATFNCQVGDIIHWFQGSGTHTTTSVSIPTGATAWNAPIDGTNTSFDYLVLFPGTYTYKCTPHGFTGTFTVGTVPINSTHLVSVESDMFSPDTVNCFVGDSVKWQLVSMVHTTTSLTQPVGAASWNAPIVAATPTFSYAVTVPGLYTYECTPHGFTGGIVATAVPQTSHIVFVNGGSFTPSSLSIPLGDTIIWVWSGTGSHTTTSQALGIPAGAAPWDNPIDAGNLSFFYVPTVLGTYNYLCTPHGFTGQFTVTSSSNTQVVTVNSNSFSPTSVNCAVGDTIKWQLAPEAHTTTSTTIPTGANPWDAVIIAATPTFIYKVTVAGTYHYKSTGETFTGVIIATPPPIGMENNTMNSSVSIYPNPVKSSFSLKYAITSESEVDISVYNLLGNKTDTFFTGNKASGNYEESFSVSDKYAPGIYFIRLKSDEKVTTLKLVIL